MLTLTWHGHACFTIEAEGCRVIIDPFLTGNPAADIGLDQLAKIGGKTVNHTGDTALTTEMQLLEGRVDVMLLPIGDNYTMGIDDAVRAVDFVKPQIAIPMHYNTWDVIKADPQEFRRKVGGRADVVVLQPGQSLKHS